jgi:hypothetical protein
MNEEITPDDWNDLEKTYKENKDLENQFMFTKNDLWKLYCDVKTNPDLDFELWYKVMFGTFNDTFSEMERGHWRQKIE